MNFKQAAGVAVVASVATAALVWVILAFTRTAHGDDTPVVMAGGSMTFITQAHSFDADPNHAGDKFRLKHKQNKQVVEVDVLYSVQNVPAVASVPLTNAKHTIEIDYGSDTVTLETDNNGKGIDMSAGDHTKDLTSASPTSSNVVNYPPSTDTIRQIRIDGTAYDCPTVPHEYCVLVIHYK